MLSFLSAGDGRDLVDRGFAAVRGGDRRGGGGATLEGEGGHAGAEGAGQGRRCR